MIVISHRINQIKDLVNLDHDLGAEIDIRSFNGDIILNHEPFSSGDRLYDWLDKFQHKFLILNIKEEGIEEKVSQIIKEFNINQYFFLDQSFPFFIKTLNSGERRTAIRISEFEDIKTYFNLKIKPEWAWIDFFSKFPLSKDEISLLKINNLKLCIVSPELQGFTDVGITKNLISTLNHFDIKIDAVCTKTPELWKQ